MSRPSRTLAIAQARAQCGALHLRSLRQRIGTRSVGNATRTRPCIAYPHRLRLGRGSYPGPVTNPRLARAGGHPVVWQSVWIPAFAGMTGRGNRRALATSIGRRVCVGRLPLLAAVGIPAFAEMTGPRRTSHSLGVPNRRAGGERHPAIGSGYEFTRLRERHRRSTAFPLDHYFYRPPAHAGIARPFCRLL